MRKRDNHSTMQKVFKLSALLLFLLIFYIVFSFVLKKNDKTPKWGRITLPDAAIPGKELVVTLDYKKINSPSQILILVIYHNQNKRYCGQKKYTDLIPKIYGTGKKQLSLNFNPPDSAYKVMVHISRYAIPEKENVSTYKRKRIGNPIISDWVPILKPGTLPTNSKLSFGKTLAKGYREGYWIRYRGDPTVIGWFITLFYFAVFATGFYFLKKTAPYRSNYEYQWFWYCVTAIIFFLGINKQLDIQMLITDFARTYAKVNSMYVNRKPFQIQIISIFATIGVGILTVMLYVLRSAPKRVWSALAGVGILFSFIIIRLVSLHRIESFISKSFLSIRIVDALELGGICIILISVLLDYFSCKK